MNFQPSSFLFLSGCSILVVYESLITVNIAKLVIFVFIALNKTTMVNNIFCVILMFYYFTYM